MRIVHPILALVAGLLFASGSVRADQILGAPRIDNSNGVILPGGPTLGTFQGGKFTAKPDAIQIRGPGSTGPVDAMSVTAPGMSSATPLSKLFGGISFNIAWFAQDSDNGDWGLACNRAVAAVLALPRGGEVHHSKGLFTYKTQCSIPKTADKAVIFSGEGEGTVLRDNGQAAPILYVGNQTDVFGSRTIVRDFMIQGVDNKSSQGMKLEWANGAIVRNVVFRDLWDAVTLTNSFAVTFEGCQDLYVQNRFIHATTIAHKLTIHNHIRNGSPGILAAIDGPSDAVTITDIDSEGSGGLIAMPGGTGFRFRGGYVEYMTANQFGFSGVMANADIDIGWLAYGQGAAATQIFSNLKNGRLRIAAAYNQTIFFDEGSITGLDVNDQSINLLGTSTIQNLPTRWRAPTLLNSWQQQANYATVRYRKEPSGEVILEGELAGGANGSVIFTLPTGFRPAAFMDFPAQSSNGGGWVQVKPDGSVVATAGVNGFTGLNGVRFRAAQ